MAEMMDWGPEGAPQAELLALVKSIGPIMAKGKVALGLAFLLHQMRLDSECQWGNAYFRCPNCGQARDCDGDENWNDTYRSATVCGSETCEGDTDLDIDDLQICEGWIERLP